MLKLSILSLLLAGTTGLAQAHEFWIEPTGSNQYKVFLGEYDLNAREHFPGMLDKITASRAIWHSKNSAKDVKSTKATDGFVIEQALAADDSLTFENSSYPVYDSEHEGKKIKAAWLPAARYVTGGKPLKPSLTLDVLPTEKVGQFAVTLRGKPLPEAKVAVITPAGWKRELSTNAQGQIELPLPWQGNYLVLVNHTDVKPGKLKGKSYQIANYATSLSFQQNTGAASLPALAASKMAE
ncbi:DUF4198 domain-containing protein [Deefgea rivuli]|uniref:DUF4198 domain-containing protein n=1 Tax=Deefgea rivuli TaxID=400948 RepID=UPI00048A0060|nr:DUF4198 domain-containing protein [Deefgea rivuli]